MQYVLLYTQAPVFGVCLLNFRVFCLSIGDLGLSLDCVRKICAPRLRIPRKSAKEKSQAIAFRSAGRLSTRQRPKVRPKS
jgi:hypothetical protein